MNLSTHECESSNYLIQKDIESETSNMTEKLLKIGAKLWKKDKLIRVYLNDAATLKLLDLDASKLSVFEKTSLRKAKTYFDVKANEFKSDIGTVRALFNQNGFKVVK